MADTSPDINPPTTEISYQRLDWRVRSDLVDIFCDELHERFGCSVQTIETDRRDFTQVRFYLTADQPLKSATMFLREFAGRFDSAAESTEPVISEVDPIDWEKRYRKSVKPELIGEHILVRPTWLQAPVIDRDQITTEIILDPQMAFGTGSHASTQLCLLALDELPLDGAIVADVGAGSGILAIFAALNGATQVEAVDTEAIAVTTCRENARLNGVAERVSAQQGSVESLSAGTRFDVVVANILLNVNLQLLPDLVRRLRPSGTLILSGLLVRDTRPMEAALRSSGVTEYRTLTSGEWVCFVCAAP